MPLLWSPEDINDISFSAYLSINIHMNDEQISELIYQCRKEKVGVESVRAHEDKTYVNIVVHDRKQIAEVIRNLRMHFGFPRVTRLAQPLNAAETPIAS